MHLYMSKTSQKKRHKTHYSVLCLCYKPERFPDCVRLHLRRTIRSHSTEYRRDSVLLPESLRIPLRRLLDGQVSPESVIRLHIIVFVYQNHTQNKNNIFRVFLSSFLCTFSTSCEPGAEIILKNPSLSSVF